MLMAIGSLMAPSVKSQVALVSPVYGNTIDTVTNTGTKVLWKKVTGYKETITITVNLTNISGTLGGTLTPIVSNDGVNFYSATGYTSSDTSYTVTNTANQGKAFTCKKGFQYYGVQWTGTGTMSGSFTGILLARRTTD